MQVEGISLLLDTTEITKINKYFIINERIVGLAVPKMSLIRCKRKGNNLFSFTVTLVRKMHQIRFGWFLKNFQTIQVPFI